MSRWLKMRVTAICLCVAIWSVASAEVLDVYFLRHAQTMANVTREYTEENQRTFSPLGEVQVDEVTEKLADLHFDVVIVSPAWRAQRTILPYLKERGLQAEIWPELYECCWDRETEEEEPALITTSRIELEDDVRAYIRFRDAEAVYMFDVDTPARGDLMVARAVELIEARFGGSGKTVLVVAHYHTGSRLLTALLADDSPRVIRPANARLSHVRQDPDGQFRLLMLNDEDVDHGNF